MSIQGNQMGRDGNYYIHLATQCLKNLKGVMQSVNQVV